MLRDLGCCLPPSVWPRPSVSLVSCPNKIARLVLLARFPAGVFGSVTLSTLLARSSPMFFFHLGSGCSLGLLLGWGLVGPPLAWAALPPLAWVSLFC